MNAPAVFIATHRKPNGGGTARGCNEKHWISRMFYAVSLLWVLCFFLLGIVCVCVRLYTWRTNLRAHTLFAHWLGMFVVRSLKIRTYGTYEYGIYESNVWMITKFLRNLQGMLQIDRRCSTISVSRLSNSIWFQFEYYYIVCFCLLICKNYSFLFATKYSSLIICF